MKLLNTLPAMCPLSQWTYCTEKKGAYFIAKFFLIFIKLKNYNYPIQAKNKKKNLFYSTQQQRQLIFGLFRNVL